MGPRALSRRIVERRAATQGELFYRVGRDPALVQDTARFATNDAATRAIVVFGLRRLAQIDPEAAAAAWAEYRKTLTFDPDDARMIRQDLTIGFARRGVIDPDADLTPSPDGRHLLVNEALILAALDNQDWPSVVSFIERLDETERAKQRWQYWLGRAQRALNAAATDADADPDNPWKALANDRQYYGFLAAEALGKKLALNDQSTRPDAERDQRDAATTGDAAHDRALCARRSRQCAARVDQAVAEPRRRRNARLPRT